MKSKRTLALLLAVLTIMLFTVSAYAEVFFLEGVFLEGLVIKKSVQVKDIYDRKAGKLSQGKTVYVTGAYKNTYFIDVGGVPYQVPVSSLAVMYDDVYLATVKKSTYAYTEMSTNKRYMFGRLDRGDQFGVFGRFGDWYVTFNTDNGEYIYIPAKNLDIYTGYATG